MLEFVDLHRDQVVDVGASELSIHLVQEGELVVNHRPNIELARQNQLVNRAVLFQGLEGLLNLDSIAVKFCKQGLQEVCEKVMFVLLAPVVLL